MLKTILLCSVLLLNTMTVRAQTVLSEARVDRLAAAIAYAEGFGKRGAIPTRYHNPGDIKAGKGVHFPGQRGVGKGHHVIFHTDKDGWEALRHQIRKMANGNSRHYNPDMTLRQIAKKYAARSRAWTNMVTKSLGIPETTKLRDFLFIDDLDIQPVLWTPSAPIPDILFAK